MVERLRMAALEAASTGAVQERAAVLGERLFVGTPAELCALLARGNRRWGEVARAAGIEPQ